MTADTSVTKKRTILLVEDDNFISTVLEKRLSEHYEVILASSTRAADEALAKQTVDLILLDIVMPDEDGFAWLKRVKTVGGTHKSVPVIILSNLDQREDVERGLALGAEAYLVKGNMLPEEVVEKIESVLKG
ncbi:MAG TPA: response regulator [Candidatus Andersenbacteria bacterium]|nr:response regulator [Candidatus Andersenbacteria bacterium]